MEAERNGYQKLSLKVEVGGQKKENTVEKVRALRMIAGMDYYGGEPISDSDSASEDETESDNPDN